LKKEATGRSLCGCYERDTAARRKSWLEVMEAQFVITLRTEYLESYKRHEYVNFQNLLQKRN
jgi:hypothetical protein